MKTLKTRHAASRGHITILTAALLGFSPAALLSQEKPAVPAPKAPVKAVPAPAAGRGTTAAPAAGRGTAAAASTGRGTTAPPAGRGAADQTGKGDNTGKSTTGGAGRDGGAGGKGTGSDGGRAGGGKDTLGAGGRGENITHSKNGEIIRDRSGKVTNVHVKDMDIHHGPGGSRTIERERADHSRVVSDRFGHGYVQRPYTYRGATFVHRTYYVGGVPYNRVYQPYVLGGVPINVYAPGFYYAPAFYGYAYYPWAAPIAFGWGWAGSPWFGYYGAYFTPYPVYAGPSLWLTDYLVAQTLQAAYVAQAAALANAQTNFTPMPPDVKQQIADEVQRQIALERVEAAAGVQTPPDPGSSGIARMLSDNTAHVFVVSAGLNVPSNAGDCAVTEGDVLRLMPGTSAASPTANLVVLASKGQDCQRGVTVVVGLADLQEMQNHMRETLDQGLAELQKKQGQNGIPPAPAAATAQPVPTAFAAIAPPPDPNDASALSAQSKEADQAEREALQSGPSAGPNPEPVEQASPASKTPLTVGQTLAEVIVVLGQPVNVVDLGVKKIYVFKDLKVTFVNGKASAFE